MSDDPQAIPTNGRGAAALLAAGIGCCALGVLALAGDASPGVAHAFNFWKPTGPLSGVTDTAILVWLSSWFAFSRLWAMRTVSVARVSLAAGVLFILGVLLTFPPFMDLLQGK